jgi:hypothetical protein
MEPHGLAASLETSLIRSATTFCGVPSAAFERITFLAPEVAQRKPSEPGGQRRVGDPEAEIWASPFTPHNLGIC